MRINTYCVFVSRVFLFFFFQAEDGIRDRFTWLEFRRVLFRSNITIQGEAETFDILPGEITDTSFIPQSVQNECDDGYRWLSRVKETGKLLHQMFSPKQFLFCKEIISLKHFNSLLNLSSEI